MRSSRLEALFPRLCQTPYEITSPEDRRYNCIAWAAGCDDLWWWPVPEYGYYWPGACREESVAAFEQVFRSLDYLPCGHADLEGGFEKVALFVKDGRPTHMARQLPSGQWTSKCGPLEDIAHTLDGVEGTRYGSVATVMKRPIQTSY